MSLHTPSHVITNSYSHWTLPKDQFFYLEKYYILHWARKYFLFQSVSGEILHEDIPYLVISYPALNPYLVETPQVALSFRKIKEWSYGLVLVRALISKHPQEK